MTRIPFSFSGPVLPLHQLGIGNPSLMPASCPPPVVLRICYLMAAQSCFLPLSVHLQPAGHHTGLFLSFWDEPPFSLIQPLACAFPEPHLKVPTTPIVGLQPCPWLGSWPLFMPLLGLGILAILLGHSWAEPAGLDTHLQAAL